MPSPSTTQRCRRWRTLIITASMLLCGLLVWAAGVQADMASSALFPIPDPLRPKVEFWKRVFAGLDTTGGMLHDMEDVTIMYHIWYNDLPSGQSWRQGAIDEERNRYRTILTTLADGKRTDLTGDERRVWDMFAGKQEPEVFRAAMSTMRFQGGMRGRFVQGLVRSWTYLPEMEAIFAAEGVPTALTRLPHVESSFENRALSKVGAAGVWQFMPSTGRRFMRVDGAVDERLNISVATQGAARLLRENYEKLGTWPLAITAYNHGAQGMKQAVATMGTTDFGVIVQRYRGPSFGFASQNFYAEFLAALEVSTNHKQYFGDIPAAEPSPSGFLEARAGSESYDFRPFAEPSQPVILEAHTQAPLMLAPRVLSEPPLVAEPPQSITGLPQVAEPPQSIAALPQVASVMPSDSLEDPVIDASTPPIVSTPLPVSPPVAIAISPAVVVPPPSAVAPAVRTTPRPAPAEPRTGEQIMAPVTPPRTVVAPRPTPVEPPRTVVAPRPTPVEPRPQAQVAAAVAPSRVAPAPRRPVVEFRSTPSVPVALAPIPVPPPVREANSKTYKVRAGDTLFAIAQRHGTDVTTVAAANRFSPQTNVKTGQTLVLPASSQPAEAPVALAARVDKPAPQAPVIPVASPFREKPTLPVQRTAWSQVTPARTPAQAPAQAPAPIPVPVPSPRGKNIPK